ncbi:efflux RND transporter periplasmic adaptor subunit [Halosquirtibacter xylanolyticus]|uniref:efflux RND transporter periplasmic adaptor subunit n=1 Tax=Halosquirtibacter xylanolyticus TaxID=3374599 RepID=UPI003747AA09|nr:efflux RND transporter periplasmic adaptor subunit [Prolixibacteraceae bacterium]
MQTNLGNSLHILLSSFLLMSLFSCSTKQEGDSELKSQTALTVDTVTKVKVKKAVKSRFHHELLSNGIVHACGKAAVPFKAKDQIVALHVVNGTRVKRGDLIATVSSEELKMRLDEAQLQYDKSTIALEDKLLGYGYSTKDSATIEPPLLKMIKIKSGFNSAVIALKRAKINYRDREVRSPLNGVISDLQAEVYNPASSYKKCCDVVDDHMVWVDFSILEGEYNKISKGEKIKVVPFANKRLELIGTVAAIDPRVDASGMVHIRAKVNNSKHQLIDGMNVNVIVQSEGACCLVVPKSAVLYRQNKNVLFVRNGKKAKWVYVTPGEENSLNVQILEGKLAEGDEVIVSNNFDLAHDTPIEVIQ